jgi:hypothetical protein
MEIPIVVEPFDGTWRARCRHPVELSATGGTRYEATQALETELRKSVPGTFTLLPLEVTPDKPWVASAGGIPDDETTETWLDAIAEYRRHIDSGDQQMLSPPPSQPVP